MRKKGVSDVVATVLIIALVIVAISIVWIGVMPMIRDRIGSSDVCNSVDVSIENSQGYTCWAQDKGLTLVQLKKGPNDVNVSKVKVAISSGGNSISYTNNNTMFRNTYAVFYLNTTGINGVDKIEVVPFVKSGNNEKACSAFYIEGVKACSASVLSMQEVQQIASSGQVVNQDTTYQNGNDIVNPASQDVMYPQFSGYVDNNVTLINLGAGLFNVSVANTNGTVLLEVNNTNITATSFGAGLYGASYNFVKSGVYSYRWYSWGNGVRHNFNSSSVVSYKVNFSAWVYQENADSYDIHEAPVPDNGLYCFDINYTKPTGATSNSLWLARYGGSSSVPMNLSLGACWNAYSNVLVFRACSYLASFDTVSYSAMECFNGSGWTRFVTSCNNHSWVAGATSYDALGAIDSNWNNVMYYWQGGGGGMFYTLSSAGYSYCANVYEEAMWWNFNP